MLAVVTFIIVFGILVIVHEFGHFYAAKKSGILVREFSIGMGPKLIQTRKNGTTYTLRLLPLGGYVRMAGTQDDDNEIKPGTTATIRLNDKGIISRIDLSSKNIDIDGIPVQIVKADLIDDLTMTVFENGEEEQEKKYSVDHDATIVEEDGTEILIAPRDVHFQSATLWRRIVTNFAGPFNNVILSIVSFMIVAFMMGGVQDLSSNQVGEVQKDTPAYSAGIREGDKIVEINNEKTKTFKDIQSEISKAKDKSISLTVAHNKNTETIKVTPKKVNGSDSKIIGIKPSTDDSFMAKVKYGFIQPFAIAAMILTVLGHMITGGFSLDQLSGPVGIYSLTSQVASQGVISVISFIGMLSINLGIMNLIPIPALDGGKLLLNFIEGIRGKPISEEREGIINLIGVVILVVLMVAVTWNDIQRFFIH
ncbi:zinc metalloprotease [Companilactobacillus sp. RD055328]|uniref:RIP metalloprotease RseP n=1 Tax=Companilactobacillus sp. RD055328 TaxID=2916634 RepID=UPI001FC8A1D7|nr:RIP metalloprotease RseP [Companilactobacillus sp. RD055328]GKQ42608.1 zinc metalloprotease [Companilactobacillus sp. RD055328]